VVFDHVTLRARDLEASVRFYGLVLGTLGIEPSAEAPGGVAWEDLVIEPAPDAGAATGHLHLGFVAPSREHVDAFWAAGTRVGYRDDGPPGERTIYRPDYYGAFLLDPDGNSAEAVHHGDTRRGGHIDHLWIGVRELAAAEHFYAAISRHTGLRPGRRWGEGVQFRGAWATFSLVADGRPPSAGLQLAFPAPDRDTVDAFHAAALRAGYSSAGMGEERQRPAARVYAACVLDPDGTRVESVARL
jgi:catechol 2,3-dioxygenase-like lactoylglutathione lyase family enzyme